VREQRSIWEELHEGPRPGGTSEPSGFCSEVALLLRAPCKVLEIGCGGGGDDAAYFAAQGHEVLATDVAETAIAACRVRHQELPGELQFSRHDASEPFVLRDASFDLVYARLSLHYFTDTVTKALFRELARLLVPGGLLAFQCKTVDDPLYGKGREIEKDMFESTHVRHFFSEDYARECLDGLFDVQSLRSERGQLYNDDSAYVKVIARKPT
jgi:SAM-dependent methyltransferase